MSDESELLMIENRADVKPVDVFFNVDEMDGRVLVNICGAGLLLAPNVARFFARMLEKHADQAEARS